MRHLGLQTVGLIVADSARRAASHRRSRRAPGRDAPVLPGVLRRVDAWHPTPGAATFHFDSAQLEVAFLATDVVRVSWGPGPAPVPYAIADDVSWSARGVQAHPIDALRSDSAWVLRSDALEVTVAPEGGVRAAIPGGPVLRQASAPVRRGSTWTLSFTIRPDERLCGLGEQAAGVDLRGGTYRLWNRDPGGSWGPGTTPLYLGIPVLVSTHPEGDVVVFFENSTNAVYRLGGPHAERGCEDTASVTFAGGLARQYLVAGPVPRALDRYTQLTGRPALPPRWALGYHHSRWGYRSDEDVRTVIEGFAAEAVPVSAVHLDIDHMRGFRVFTVDAERFGDLRDLTAHAARHGVRIVTIVDPGVKVDGGFPLYVDGTRHDRFCTDAHGRAIEGVVWAGRSVFPDFTAESTRAWWAAQYQGLVDAGVGGVWHDMNEPTSLALVGDRTLPVATRHDFDGRGGDHAEAHNLYGLLMNRAGYEGLRDAQPGRRPFVVSRAGWAGMQRWAWTWTGDTSSTWASLRQQIATIVGLGLSGVPYAGSDIGGFSGEPDDELFLRWLQMSVFMPYCRTHSVVGVPPREPWCFEEPTRRLVGAWIRFRYRLLPYLYTLAHDAARTGAPLVRPLWWPRRGSFDEATEDGAETAAATGPAADDDRPAARPGTTTGVNADDAFLLGDHLLVAPVTEPGGRRRTVPLPPGCWASVWAHGERGLQGAPSGVAPSVAAPFERVPVLARAGSVVPLDDGWAEPEGPCVVDADDHVPRAVRTFPVSSVKAPLVHAPRVLSFHCWPDEAGVATGRCVDDAGDGEVPARSDEVRLEGARAGSTARCTWVHAGDGPPPPRVRVVLHGLVVERAWTNTVAAGVVGSVVDCPAFSELTLDGLRLAPSPKR
jgi:alpha-glucosidase